MTQNWDRFKFRLWIEGQNDNGMYYFNLRQEVTLIAKYTIMQSTGLKDKNGNLIYEGDVLKAIWKEKQDLLDKNEIFYKIEYETNGCWFRVIEIEAARHRLVLDDFFAEHAEIIGNIYENPELLENNN